MRIAGVMAVKSFPMWRRAFDSMYELSDVVCVRFDGINGDPEILRELKRIHDQPDSKLVSIDVVTKAWECPSWREDCIRALDGIPNKPDIVITPDEDEVFGDGFKAELEAFMASDKYGMMFSYEPIMADDGREINGGMPYPPDPHMKAYKYADGLTYFPYHGDGKIARYSNPGAWWTAKTKIKHYCAWTKAMQEAKHWRSDTPMARGNKRVTLLGFGPSIKQAECVGEVWSLNDCYQVFPEQLMKRVTRIFEMHSFEKREKMLTKDGQLHFDCLDGLGHNGHRIIMQTPHPNICNSEAYPLSEVRKAYPPGFFTGTPSYMIAMAILEGYTEIRVYGFDQCDWEHVLQRNSWIWWCGIAVGQGIALSGCVTFLDVFSKRLYGYEYGPEFDNECQRLLWTGFPFEIKSKVESQAVMGDLHGNQK